MSGTHSILSPSKAHMVTRCVGALAASKGVKDAPSSYAAEGTAYHELAAQVLNGQVHACANSAGMKYYADGFEFIIDEENAAYAQTYVDAIRRLPGQQYFEVRLDTSEVVGVPGQSGTADAISADIATHTLHVDDLKFGRGEVVDAFDNEQLLIYGAAALLRFALLDDWAYLKIAIHQPRINHYSEQVYAVDKVWDFIAKLKPRFQKAYELYENTPADLTPYLSPSEKGCRWCPRRGNCSARANKIMAMFPVNAPTARATTMSDAEIGAARERVEFIEQWCKDIKEEAHKRALSGRAIPGWKLVQGRKGNRKWKDGDDLTFVENIMFADLQDGAYAPRKLLTPAEAEKAYKKAKRGFGNLESYITQADGALSLERETASKPAVDRPMVEFPIAEPLA